MSAVDPYTERQSRIAVASRPLTDPDRLMEAWTADGGASDEWAAICAINNDPTERAAFLRDVTPSPPTPWSAPTPALPPSSSCGCAACPTPDVNPASVPA